MRKPIIIDDDTTFLEAINILLKNGEEVAIIGEERRNCVVTLPIMAKIVLKNYKIISEVLNWEIKSVSMKVPYVSERKKLSDIVKNLGRTVQYGNLIFVGKREKIIGYLKPEDLFSAYSKNFLCNDVNTNFFDPIHCIMVYPNKSIKAMLYAIVKRGVSCAFLYSRSGFKGVIEIKSILEEFITDYNVAKILSGEIGYFYEATVSELKLNKNSCLKIEEIDKEKIVSILSNNGHIVIVKDRNIYRAMDDKNLLYFIYNVLFKRSL